MQWSFIYTCTCNTTSKRRMYLKGLVSTSIASVITAAEQLLEEMGATHIWIVTIIPSTTRSISERIPTSNKIFSLIPYLKQCGDLVWWMLGCRPLCWPFAKGSLPIGRGYTRLVVTLRKAVHQRHFAGTWTLPSLNSNIHYYTLHYWSVFITSMQCWCFHWLAS